MPAQEKKLNKKTAKSKRKKTKSKKNTSHKKKEEVLIEKEEKLEKEIEKNIELLEKESKDVVSEEQKIVTIVEKENDIEKEEEHVFVKKDLPEEEHSVDTQNNDVVSSNEISQKLTEIYEDDAGDMPDMHQFQKSKRSGFLRAFFILIFSFIFFAAVAWIGFFVIQPGNKFSEEDVILTMSGNEDFVSGEENVYRIRYKNSQNVALHNVNIEVRYPKGFVFSSSTRDTIDDNHDSWNLGELVANSSGYIDVVGKVYGNLNDEQSFRIFLNYTPDNFSSLFQKVTSLSIKNSENLVNIDVVLPEQIVAGLDTPVKIVVSPNSDVVLENVTVKCESESFSFKSSDPKIVDGKKCEWFFPKLEASQEINISGFFSEVKESSSFKVSVSNWDNIDMTGNSYVLADIEKEITLSNIDTVYNLVINGSASSFDMQPGDTINATVLLKNNGESVLKNAKLKLILDAPAYKDRSILDWSALDMIDLDGDIVGQKISDSVRRGTITWDKRYIEGLSEISPGDEVRIDISLPIKDSSGINLADYVAHVINASSQLSYEINGKEETLGSNKLDIKLISDLKMATEDNIDKDVEGNTVHKITWLLTNSYHDLKNIEISADLYGDISLEEENIVVPAGTITYDKEQKKLNWQIEQMPTSVDILAAQFEITILADNPSQNNLTSKPVVKAFDDTLQEKIQVFGKDILLNNN
ncbi:MAG: hypothetical protein COX80_03935 [Candidatus Magasanikbacteria bacterium CG_4_10_14_0_2_um_filter_33_14]|uniref:DUF11 domain-containing protein n=1 Tax=Candidatus Magasanikbacteria bacterium CG_4_10_14_0_2_um_filter_33_14 TaxID=1974636 RepID=A0A2M7V9U3_9BACT|nr:MAG: hypothetical protein COX80_03935 [Candidatus Magasanikbacteria bacterium CG_4_10_14_0_2_um_filter_33_14]